MITEALFRKAISQSVPDWDVGDILSDLRDTSPLKEYIADHVAKVAFLRCMFLMLPDIDPQYSYNIRKKIVEKFLNEHFKTVDKTSVDFVVELTAKISAANRGFRKDSLSDLHYETRADVLAKQGGRCKVCGVVLDKSGDASSPAAPQLDHVIPFGLGGNAPDNLSVICRSCNQIKSDDISSITADAIDINYFLKARKKGYKRRLQYWVNVRDACKCTESGCDYSAADSQLHIKKISDAGRLVYDNVRTVCEHCL